MTRLFRLAVVTSLATYALIVLGGIARVSGSETGCQGGWPGCRGRWYPPFELRPIVDYLHGTVAVAVGLLVLATAVGTLLARGTGGRTRLAAWAAFGVVLGQGLVGAVGVGPELPPAVVTAQLGTAMVFFGLTLLTALCVALDGGVRGWLGETRWAAGGRHDRRFRRVAWGGAGIILLLILTGASTSTTGAALACSGWPLCQGNELIPERASAEMWINLGHRATAAIGALAVAAVAWEAWRRPAARAARGLAAAAVGTTLLQILLGGAYVVNGGSAWRSAAHLALATLLWGLMLAIAVVASREEVVVGMGSGATSRRPTTGGGVEARRGRPAPVRMAVEGGAPGVAVSPLPGFPALWVRLPDPRRVRGVVADYVALTKPGILSLLLVTTFGAMLIAAEGVPPLGLIVATLVGGALAAGGANALNCFLDRDIDARMARTRGRATAAGRISPPAALSFGLTLTTVAVLGLGVLVNWLAAGLALAGNLFYVLVYTKWLKRTTPQNIVIGGAAGAVPPLVGWAAAAGGLAPAAWALFAVIFFWTPPHFWALALLKHGEYGRAEVPMLPVVAGEAETRRQILLYSLLLLAVCLLLVPLGLGWLYLLAAVGLNGVFVGLAVRLFRDGSKALARRLFFFSLWYLALLFAAAVADRLILA